MRYILLISFVLIGCGPTPQEEVAQAPSGVKSPEEEKAGGDEAISVDLNKLVEMTVEQVRGIAETTWGTEKATVAKIETDTSQIKESGSGTWVVSAVYKGKNENDTEIERTFEVTWKVHTDNSTQRRPCPSPTLPLNRR